MVLGDVSVKANFTLMFGKERRRSSNYCDHPDYCHFPLTMNKETKIDFRPGVSKYSTFPLNTPEWMASHHGICRYGAR